MIWEGYSELVDIQSEDEGEHGLSSLRVLVSELLSISPMLIQCPDGHLYN